MTEIGVNIAVFALQYGVEIFHVDNDNLQQDNLMLDSIIFQHNKTNDITLKKTRQKLSSFQKKVCVELQHISLIIEQSNFIEAVDYLRDAIRAIGCDNTELFKESITFSYHAARTSKTKIKNNINFLLGTYCIIIVCGFFIFSKFGADVHSGLLHIYETLFEISNNKTLTTPLDEILDSKFCWSKQQKIYLTNILLFSILTTTYISKCVLIVDYNIKNPKKQKCPNLKKLGSVISFLFPNLNNAPKAAKLFDFKKWCPNIENGEYFGVKKQFKKINFKNIYSLLFKVSENFQQDYKKQIHEYIEFKRQKLHEVKHNLHSILLT